MNWKEAREIYPEQWLLLEAIKAHSEGKRRMVEDLSVVSSFDDSEKALCEYLELHRQNPTRELYVAHTSLEELDIQEKKWLGVRAAA